jgi:hypothetical protein
MPVSKVAASNDDDGTLCVLVAASTVVVLVLQLLLLVPGMARSADRICIPSIGQVGVVDDDVVEAFLLRKLECKHSSWNISPHGHICVLTFGL